MGDLQNKTRNQLKPTPPPKPRSPGTPTTPDLDALLARVIHLEDETSQQHIHLTTEIANLRGDFAELHTNYGRLEKENKQVQEDNQQLQSDVTRLHTERTALRQELSALRLYLDLFQADHSKVKRDLEKLSSQIKDVKTETQAEINNVKTETQAEINHVRTETQAEITHVRTETQAEINDVRIETQAELHNVRTETQAEISHVRTETQTDINNVRTETQAEGNDARTGQQKRVSGVKEESAQKSCGSGDGGGDDGGDVTPDTPSPEEPTTSAREKMTSQSAEDVLPTSPQQGLPPPPPPPPLQSDFHQLLENHTNLQAEISRLKQEHHQLTNDQTHLKADVNRLQTDQDTLLQDVVVKVTKSQQDLQADVAKLQTQMDTVRSEQTVLEMTLTEQQRNHVEIVLEEERLLQHHLDRLASDVDVVRMEVLRMKTFMEKDSLRTTSITSALEARLGKPRQLFDVKFLDKDNTQINQAMIFQTVKVNEGGHYIHPAGVFRAPCAGLYCFNVTLGSCTKDTSVHGHFMVDDVRHSVIQGGYDGGSGCVMVSLTAGQRVRVRAVSVVDQYSSIYSWFRGMLVLPFP